MDENPISCDKEEFQKLLEQTSGIWKQEYGLAYQNKLRDEWNDH